MGQGGFALSQDRSSWLRSQHLSLISLPPPALPLLLLQTEFVGTGIIMSIVTSQLCQQYLSRTVGKGCTWLASCAVNSFVYTIT